MRALIQRKECDGWNFAYMGANQDSYAVGGAMGMRAGFTRNYAATAAGVRGTFGDLAEKTRLYRRAKAKGVAAAPFFDAPKREGDDPGAGKLAPKK